MVLYLIGLGLGNEDDITLRGLKAIQSSKLIFLEHYTSILPGMNDMVTRLEESYKCTKIQLADRNMVESEAEKIYEPALESNVAFLVVGDPVCATTHADLILRAQTKGISVEIIHNASIMGAVASCGLQLYQFGQTISIPFFTDEWKPTSFYSKILYNRRGGLHTLCLLDIKVKEPDYQAMMQNMMKRGGGMGSKTVSFLPPRYMSVSTCCQQLIEVESIIKNQKENQEGDEQNDGDKNDAMAYDSQSTLCVGVARLGSPSEQKIVAGTMAELAEVDFGTPLHSFIICGEPLHDLELEMLKQFMVPNSQYKLAAPDESINTEQLS